MQKLLSVWIVSLLIAPMTFGQDESAHLLESLTIGGVIEAEAAWESSEEDSSDLVLATFELGIVAEPTDEWTAEAVLLWEEDDTDPIDLDAAFITYTPAQGGGLYIQAGRLYLPFGAYPCFMVSDPLTLELGETRETAGVLGWAAGWMDARAGAFNGDTDKDGDDDTIGDWFAALTVMPAEGLEIGLSYLSDMAETDSLQDGMLTDEISGEPIPYTTETAGLAAFVYASAGPASLAAEYITATDDFESGRYADTAVKPSAWNIELACDLSDRLSVAARCEGSDEFMTDEMPELQWGAAAGWALSDSVGLSLEYLRGSFENEDAEDRDLVTAQLALEF